jgi:hypothetical protein
LQTVWRRTRLARTLGGLLLALVCTALAGWGLTVPGGAASPEPQAALVEETEPPTTAAVATPIPLPESAENIGFDGAAGTLAFDSLSSMATLADFYRAGLTRDGWIENHAPITRPKMIALSFAKDDKTLSFTILQMASHATVDADGSGLISMAPELTGSLDAER